MVTRVAFLNIFVIKTFRNISDIGQNINSFVEGPIESIVVNSVSFVALIPLYNIFVLNFRIGGTFSYKKLYEISLLILKKTGV